MIKLRESIIKKQIMKIVPNSTYFFLHFNLSTSNSVKCKISCSYFNTKLGVSLQKWKLFTLDAECKLFLISRILYSCTWLDQFCGGIGKPTSKFVFHDLIKLKGTLILQWNMQSQTQKITYANKKKTQYLC